MFMLKMAIPMGTNLMENTVTSAQQLSKSAFEDIISRGLMIVKRVHLNSLRV